MESQSPRPSRHDPAIPEKHTPRVLGGSDDTEDRPIDEHLYSSWLSQIRQPTAPEPEIDLARRTEIIEGLIASDESGGLLDPSPSPEAIRMVAAPPQIAKEGPVSLYRLGTALGSIAIAMALLLVYQVVLPQRRAEAYRTRITAALGELDKFDSVYPQLLDDRIPGDLREASVQGNEALRGVTSFKRVAAEPAPRKLPLAIFSGRPDPLRLEADTRSVLGTLEPIAEQVRLRAALYESVADYREQLSLASTVLTSDGLEGGDKSLALRGIQSNLEGIRATMQGVAVPKGCEELYRAVVHDLEALMSEIRAFLDASRAVASQPLSPQPDPASLNAAITQASSTLATLRIERALPAAALDEYRARLEEFTSRYAPAH